MHKTPIIILAVLAAAASLCPADPRFGSLKLPNARVRNVRIAGDTYDVELAEGVTVRRNGEPFLECTTRAIVRIPLLARREHPIHISTTSPGSLVLNGTAPAARGLVGACVNGGLALQPAASGPCEEYAWREVPSLGAQT